MTLDRPLRVGAVSYLNTRPLVYSLDQLAPDAELRLDLPSRLADQLAEGALDVALIPSIEVFRDPDYRVVSDACIACRGAVMSVKLLSRVPIAEIRTLSLDEGSRTSVALVRILLKHRFGVQPDLVPLAIGDDPCDTATDAVLLIGDRAMHPPRDTFAEAWDLGQQWCRWSGLPFVFAMWTARRDAQLGCLPEALERARDAGLRHLAEIAAQEAPRAGLSREACLGYLRDNLYFYLGPEQRRGLDLFRRYAHELGLVDAEEPRRRAEHGCQTPR